MDKQMADEAGEREAEDCRSNRGDIREACARANSREEQLKRTARQSVAQTRFQPCDIWEAGRIPGWGLRRLRRLQISLRENRE